MTKTHFISILFLVFAFSCKKEAVDAPVNQDNVNAGLDCRQCFSSFLSAETPEDETICDDFTDIEAWPATELEVGEFGFTQEGVYPITYEDGDLSSVNMFGNSGIFGVGFFNFAMSGEFQVATFEIYSYDLEFTEMYAQVNESESIFISDAFPLVVDGVTVDFEIIIEADIFVGQITFTGNVETVDFYLFESGITDLCVTHPYTGPPILGESQYVAFSDFYDYDGSVLGSYPNAKTPLGHYGFQATNLIVNLESYFGHAPEKFGFVHAYFEGNSNLVNVQLPGTPLIVTVPDSLNYYLSPFGYAVVNYTQDGVLWENETSPPIVGAQVDSIIITGNDLGQVTVGANLQESEIRSICTYYE